jgi:hypothetical protein
MARAMPSAKTLLGSAGATAAIGIRVARSLHARWRFLTPADRERIAPLAEDAKERALELRGAPDREVAERDLAAANQTLAAALVESAEADPEVSEVEVTRLREDLRRELDRLAGADVSASRGPGASRRP